MDNTSLPPGVSDVICRIKAILQDLLQRPDLVLTARTNSDDVEGWDSLVHLKLLSALEETYAVVFGVEEIEAPADIGELAALVAKLQSVAA